MKQKDRLDQLFYFIASSLPQKGAKTEIQGFQPFGYSVFIGLINTEKLYFLKLNVTKQCVRS